MTRLKPHMIDGGSAADGQVLIWDAAQGRWIPGTVPGGGGGSTPGPWIDLALATGIESHASSFGGKPQYRANGDRVEMRGIARKVGSAAFSAGSEVTLFTLPVGYRPALTPGSAVATDPTKIAKVYPVITENATARGRIFIYGNGRVSINAGDQMFWIPLDGIPPFSTTV